MPISFIDLRGVPEASLTEKLPRPDPSAALPTKSVQEILAQVREKGDAALFELTERFDQVTLRQLRVDGQEIYKALQTIGPELRAALELAWRRIVAYHAHEPQPLADFESEGVLVRHLVRPVRRAGIYAPGGRARYPSTVLMCAAPARVAGVEELALVVPPGPGGSIAPQTLAAAAIAGIDEVYAVGGAQAIGALAFGTATIEAVEVIVGPGNIYVAEAKRQVAGLVGVPSAFAGPSEVVVVADGSVPARWSAVDLVVQAEHGPDGLAWLVTWSESVAREVAAEVEAITLASRRRSDIEATLARGGFAVVVDGAKEAMQVANWVAPEHLELQVSEPGQLLAQVRSAGAVFLGPYSPASIGDYLAGPNHVLPTARSARFSSALRVDDFRTHIHAVEVRPDALGSLGPAVVELALAEGLGAHAESVSLRLAESDPLVAEVAGDGPADGAGVAP